MIFLSKIFRILAPKFKLKFLPLSTLNFSAKIQQQFNIILWAKIQIIKNPKKNCSYFCCKNSDTIFLNLEINRNHHKNYYNFDAKIQFFYSIYFSSCLTTYFCFWSYWWFSPFYFPFRENSQDWVIIFNNSKSLTKTTEKMIWRFLRSKGCNLLAYTTNDHVIKRVVLSILIETFALFSQGRCEKWKNSSEKLVWKYAYKSHIE